MKQIWLLSLVSLFGGIIIIPIALLMFIFIVVFAILGIIFQGISEACTWVSINMLVWLSQLGDFVKRVYE